MDHTYDSSHRYAGLYWGGDLEGVRQKLDYLADLGVTKIILSPIQDNANGLLYSPSADSYIYLDKQETQNEVDPFYAHASSAFHGYWMKDWYEIDEHYRNPEDEGFDRFRILRQLLNEAEEKGIGVILDLTMNHTSPFHYNSLHPVFYPDQIGFWFADNGAVYRHGELAATFWDPANSQLDPLDWFHPLKGIDFNRPTQKMVEEGTLPGGLPDLDQEVPAVNEYLLDAVKFWVNFNQEGAQVAGFRLDAVKHINIKFWRQVEDTVMSLNPDAILIGEFFSAGYRNLESVGWYNQTENYTFFNFNLSMPARRFFARDRNWDGRTEILRETTLGRQGRYYNYPPLQKFIHWVLNPAETLEIPRTALDSIPDEDGKAWVNFIENHDEPRLLTTYPEMSEQAYRSLIKFIFTSPGVPMLMYGVETGLALPYHPKHEGLFGIGGDPFNRQMMIWPDTEGWDNRYYETTRDMSLLRGQHPVLRYGDTDYLYPQGSRQDADLFMVRDSSECDERVSDCDAILYAYSTFGGEFLLSFGEEGYSQFEDAETHTVAGIMDGLLPLRLHPEESKVLVLQ